MLKRDAKSERKVIHTTAVSRRGYGSGTSARTLYTCRKALSDVFERLVILSISVW